MRDEIQMRVGMIYNLFFMGPYKKTYRSIHLFIFAYSTLNSELSSAPLTLVPQQSSKFGLQVKTSPDAPGMTSAVVYIRRKGPPEMSTSAL